jgi:hypothetical protein
MILNAELMGKRKKVKFIYQRSGVGLSQAFFSLGDPKGWADKKKIDIYFL